jgi:hypothetical protein
LPDGNEARKTFLREPEKICEKNAHWKYGTSELHRLSESKAMKSFVSENYHLL